MKADSPALKCRFFAWKKPPRNWKSWVEKLCSAHQSTWKDAGIYEAIMSSTYGIERHNDLILELASRWCSETNTFVFPWGEATLTLEDMYVLAGFSPSGLSLLCSLENDVELLKIKERLELARKEIVRSRSNKAAQGKWMEKFIECGSDMEHEAFLSLWLSRFVFPVGFSGIINKDIFPLAIKLSRGVKIALGPAVLAMLYRDLTVLAKRLSCFTQLVSVSRDNVGQLDLCALFQLVQIWAWERFPTLKPIKKFIYSDGKSPRLAGWSSVKVMKNIDLRSALDSAEDAFVWRPYNAPDEHGGRDLHSFAFYTKASELVGFDFCIEKYQPQRVARQFGLDQDIPIDKNTLDEVKLDATSAPSKATVTARYQQWWKQQTNLTSSQVKVENTIDLGPPPGFCPRITVITIDDSDSDDDCCQEDEKPTITELLKRPFCKTGSNTPFPSIASADVAIEAEDASFKEAKIEESEIFNKHQNFPSRAPMKRDDYDGCVPCGSASQVKQVNVDDSDVDDKRFESVLPEHSKQGKTAGSIQNEIDGMEGKGGSTDLPETGSSAPHNDLSMSCDAESYTNEKPEGLGFDLEARISRLEKMVAHIKAQRQQVK